MSSRPDLYRQFLQTLSRIPKTTPPDDLSKLERLQGLIANDAKLLNDSDLNKRERLVREYEDEFKKSSKQSLLIGQAIQELEAYIQATTTTITSSSSSSKRTAEPSASSTDHNPSIKRKRLGLSDNARSSPAISNRSLSPNLPLSGLGGGGGGINTPTRDRERERERDRDRPDRDRPDRSDRDKDRTSKIRRTGSDHKDPHHHHHPGSTNNNTTTTTTTTTTTSSSRDPSSYPYARQLPLQPGRKVAFKPPPSKNTLGDEGKHIMTAETGWILAIVKGMIGGDKGKYEVEDPDPEAAQKVFSTTLKSIIPLPLPSAPPTSPSHPNAYGEHPIKSRVAAIYPDTSSFYWATVLPPPPNSTVEFKQKGRYLILFDDDDGRQTEMPLDLILDAAALKRK